MDKRKGRTGFVYDELFSSCGYGVPEEYPEKPVRVRAVLDAVDKSAINLLIMSPRRASFDELCLAHSRSYVESIEAIAEKRIEGYVFGDETYFSIGSFEMARLAVGAVLVAVDSLKKFGLKRVFCAIRPPGHHAERSRAGGFCIFNNVAIGARYAQKQGFRKIFIIDFDAHHGNGTQHIFEQENTIYYFSTHLFPDYPGTGKSSEQGIGLGKGFTCNIPLAAGSGDMEYATVFRGLLPKLVENFRPDLILVSAGYDIHRDDRLTDVQLNVSDKGIRLIARSIIQSASLLNVPVIFVLEGGYNLPALSRGVVATLEEMRN